MHEHLSTFTYQCVCTGSCGWDQKKKKPWLFLSGVALCWSLNSTIDCIRRTGQIPFSITHECFWSLFHLILHATMSQQGITRRFAHFSAVTATGPPVSNISVVTSEMTMRSTAAKLAHTSMSTPQPFFKGLLIQFKPQQNRSFKKKNGLYNVMDILTQISGDCDSFNWASRQRSVVVLQLNIISVMHQTKKADAETLKPHPVMWLWSPRYPCPRGCTRNGQ